jgi:8-hydroxy-5-deazaflavin:NADPH oxidoreductase
VLLAVPWPQIEAALTGLPDWQGRILIDATNSFIETVPKLVPADQGGLGSSVIVAKLVPGAASSIRMAHYDAGPRRADARRLPAL